MENRERGIVIVGAANVGRTAANVIITGGGLISLPEDAVVEIKEQQSPFAPEPTMIITPNRQFDYCLTEPINTGQKKFRKKNNRKHKSKRK